MNKQRSKQKEAKFFYDKMVEARNIGNYEHLKHYISAFVNAARTIQQFTHKDAEMCGKENEYQELVRGNAVFQFFRRIRNDNIHEKLIETSRIGSSSMSGRLIVNTPETSEEQLATFQKEAKEKELAEIKTEIHYYFEEWDGPEDVFTLAEKYLDQLDDFILDAERRGIILSC